MIRLSSLTLRLAALALVVGAAGSALAQPLGQPANGRLTPQQWQKIFPEHRNLAIRDHQARIAILQKGESCVAAAGNGDALRECMKQERTAYQQQRQAHRTEMLRLLERNGIPVPEWGNRGGRGGAGQGAARSSPVSGVAPKGALNQVQPRKGR
jgi:hypothetical protein